VSTGFYPWGEESMNECRKLHYAIDERKFWMDVLANAGTEELLAHFRDLRPRPKYQLVGFQERGRRARTRARRCEAEPASKDRAIHCVIRLQSGVTGSACVRGPGKRHAEIAAVFDALLKEPESYDELIGTVIESIAYNVLPRADTFHPGADPGQARWS
jgi:alpha-D-ribose 1-methylphosphonate 5-triphosphate synthase subunit PhnG